MKKERLWVARGPHTHFFSTRYPRKWLMDYYGVKHADKIYRGDGDHVGWIINGNWFEVFELTPLYRISK